MVVGFNCAVKLLIDAGEEIIAGRDVARVVAKKKRKWRRSARLATSRWCMNVLWR